MRLIALALALLLATPAGAETLSGQVATTDFPTVHFTVQVNDRPLCIPAYATTNEQMKVRYRLGVKIEGVPIWFGARHIPKRGCYSELAPKIAKMWPELYMTPCMVYVRPIAGYPGAFTFRAPGGPHGWIDWIAGTKQYRFWFDPKAPTQPI